MAGWNLKCGSITEYNVSEERLWSLFNFLFSDSGKKRNTYKFGLLKSFLSKKIKKRQQIDIPASLLNMSSSSAI